MNKEWQKEFKEKQTAGDAVDFVILQGKKAVRCLMIKSDTEEILKKSGLDVVIKFTSDGRVHIIGDPKKEINCMDLLPVLRIEEAKKMKVPFDKINKEKLADLKSHPAIQKWQFDVKRCAIINLKPTLLEPAQIKKSLEIGLDIYRYSPECPSKECIGKKCSWYSYNLMRCRMLRKEKIVDTSKLEIRQMPFQKKWAEMKSFKLDKKLPTDLINKKFSKIAKFILK